MNGSSAQEARSGMRSKLLFFSVVWVVFIGLALKRIGDDPVQGDDRIPASARPLYERVGGKDALEQWAAEMGRLISADVRMGANKQFKILWANANQARLRRSFVEFICERANGPCKYDGPSLRKVFDGNVFGSMEWLYLREAYLTSLRKTQGQLAPEDRAAFERVFEEAQAQIQAPVQPQR